MRITQAAAIVVKVGEDRWSTVISLNDEDAGPGGARISIVNAEGFDQKTKSRAAKTALEVIDGLKLESLVSDVLPVMSAHGVLPDEENITQEFRDHLTRLDFTEGRYWIDVGPNGEVRLSGTFIDRTSDKAFVWHLSPQERSPRSVADAANLGAALFAALGLEDTDHGHHLVNGPATNVRVVDDHGQDVIRQ